MLPTYIAPETVKTVRKYISENKGLTPRIYAAKIGVNVSVIHQLAEYDRQINSAARRGEIKLPTGHGFSGRGGRRPDWFHKLPASTKKSLLETTVSDENEQIADCYIGNLPVTDPVLRAEYGRVLSAASKVLAALPAARAHRLATEVQETIAIVAIDAETDKVVLNSQRTMLASLTATNSQPTKLQLLPSTVKKATPKAKKNASKGSALVAV